MKLSGKQFRGILVFAIGLYYFLAGMSVAGAFLMFFGMDLMEESGK